MNWVIDAGLSKDADEGLFCFCPIEKDGSVVTGLTVFAAEPPGDLIGIFHENKESLQPWIDDHRDAILALAEHMEVMRRHIISQMN